MDSRARALAVVVLASAACFNPSGSDPSTSDPTDPTGSLDPSTSATTSTTGTTATTTTTTGEPTTDVPLTTTAATTDTTTAPAGCVSDVECPPATPNCEAGKCVGCTDDDGCTDAAPVCETGACRGCLYHHECGKACDIAEGICFPESTLEYTVVPSQSCEFCSDGKPCCSIKEALQVAADAPGDYVKIVLTSMGPDNVGIVIGPDYPDKVIALFGAGQNPVIQPAGGPAFELLLAGPDKRVYLSALRFAGGLNGTGVKCDGGQIWLDRVVIDSFATTPGLTVASCPALVRRSSIIHNSVAISIVGGLLTLRDSVVGGSPGAAAELFLGAGSHLDARYVTVVDEVGGLSGLLACAANGEIGFENSIVVGAADMLGAPGCNATATRSVISPGLVTRPGDDNAPAVFADFEFTPTYRLTSPETPARDVARWHTGYSPIDIDGTARPTKDDAPDYAGADIPPI